MLFRLGRAEACVGGLGAFGRSALWLRFPTRRVLAIRYPLINTVSVHGSIGQYTNMGIGVQHGLERGSESGLLALTWDAKSYNAGSLKICVQGFSHKPKSL
jgi:hypothetical protein